MNATENLPLMFGLIGLVVIFSALLSGFVERSNFPQVAVFLGLGAIVGPYGLGWLNIGLDSPMLRMVATLSLSLVLFTDALTIEVSEVKKHFSLAAIILGPGTLIAAAIMMVAGVYVLNLSWPMAAILAAPLASTDPVMLRGLLKRPDLPMAARRALQLESGLNDIVLLPIVLVAMALAMPSPGHDVGVGRLLVQMLIVGPGLGALVAWVGISLLVNIRKQVGIRRDYESLYSLGIALAAFAAAESLHGSGFLAVFAAGLMISAIDVELCDCFREYGETTAEILLLFTFVILGSSLIWAGISSTTVVIGVFVAIALMARPLTLIAALTTTKTDREAKNFIVWYGPRGLSTLLLILIPVFEKVPGANELFHISTVVVLVSVALHGGSIMFFGNKAKRTEELSHEPASVETPTPSFELVERRTVDEVRELIASGEPVHVFDVRREDPYLKSDTRVDGALRLHPQFARRDAIELGISKDSYLAVFCSCPDDKTAVRVAGELQSAGWTGAFAITGGLDALIQGGYPIVKVDPEMS